MRLLGKLRRLMGWDAPKISDIAVIDHVDEEAAPEGALCTFPTREAWDRAIRDAAPGQGIREEDLEKCGKPAIVSVKTFFKNCKPMHHYFCEECRPSKLPPEKNT